MLPTAHKGSQLLLTALLHLIALNCSCRHKIPCYEHKLTQCECKILRCEHKFPWCEHHDANTSSHTTAEDDDDVYIRDLGMAWGQISTMWTQVTMMWTQVTSMRTLIFRDWLLLTALDDYQLLLVALNCSWFLPTAPNNPITAHDYSWLSITASDC